MKRWISPVLGLALVAATGGALLGGPASPASAEPTTYTGGVSVIENGTTVGCLTGAYEPAITPDPAAATQFSVQAGTGQNLQIAGTSRVLGLSAGNLTDPNVYSYGFIDPMSPVAPGANGVQSAVWSFDPTTKALTPIWAFSASSSGPVTIYDDTEIGYLGVTTNLTTFQSHFPMENAVEAHFVLGGVCGGNDPQAITFTSQPAATTYPGQSYTATATGGDSGNAVTFSSATPDVCYVDPTTGVTDLQAPGTCTIDADQAGATGYDAAPTATQDITISAIPATVTLSTDVATPVAGQPTTATADVMVAEGDIGAAGGTVQFAADGTALGSPVALDADARATSVALPSTVGDHDITATYTPADTIDYVGSEATTTVSVARAHTASTLTVLPHALVATVAPVAPGAGRPSGHVGFSVDGTTVGSATLTRSGTATLAYTASTKRSHAVAAVYAGDPSFLSSSASTSRSNPTLTAHVHGAHAHGWYRGTVTVSFTCRSGGSTLVGACPARVVVRHQGVSTVTRTIRTTAGGVATTSATVKVDHTAPVVKLTGVRAGGTYVGAAPKAGCRASDRLSGLATCRVTTVRHGSRVTTTAVATDKAGNRARAHASATILDYAIEGATLRHGVWQIKRGSTYTIVALGAQPRYVDASRTPTRPSKVDAAFHRGGSIAGRKRWVIGVTMSMSVSGTRNWELGIKQGNALHILRVHVNG